jgi:hypothetical protein
MGHSVVVQYYVNLYLLSSCYVWTYVSTRISKIPVLVRALPVLERVPVLVRAYARFSTGFAFSAMLFWWPVPV